RGSRRALCDRAAWSRADIGRRDTARPRDRSHVLRALEFRTAVRPCPLQRLLMLRASITFGVVLSFMILMLPAHGTQTLAAQQPGGGGRGGGQAAAAGGPIPAIETRTSGMQKIDGYFPLYWDERSGSLFIEIPRLDTEFLLTTGLSAGLGSNDIGLDRGAGGGGRLVVFQRVGPRVLLVQPNQSFRSSSANTLERKSVEDSFA